MAFRFKLDEPIDKGFRRIGAEQLVRAHRQISAGADPAREVHEARKALKRVRALLRLGREGLTEDVFRSEMARIRALAAQLAPARDRHVLRETLAGLAAVAPPSADGAIARFRQAMTARETADPSPEFDPAEAAAELDRALEGFRRIRLAPNTFATVASGLTRCYRKARASFAAAYDEPTDEAFHTWRKGVQTYWRHMALLSRAWPEHFEANVAAARDLSQILGHDHDLALLAEALARLPEPALTDEDRATISALIHDRQSRLRRLAEPRGALLFAEGPKAFRRRSLAIWLAATARARLDRDAETEDVTEPDAAATPPSSGEAGLASPGKARD